MPVRARPTAWCAVLLAPAVLLGACGTAHRTPTADSIPHSLIAEARPIGNGPRFRPPVSGRSGVTLAPVSSAPSGGGGGGGSSPTTPEIALVAAVAVVATAAIIVYNRRHAPPR